MRDRRSGVRSRGGVLLGEAQLRKPGSWWKEVGLVIVVSKLSVQSLKQPCRRSVLRQALLRLLATVFPPCQAEAGTSAGSSRARSSLLRYLEQDKERGRKKKERRRTRKTYEPTFFFWPCKRLVSTSGLGQLSMSTKSVIYTTGEPNLTRFCKLGGGGLRLLVWFHTPTLRWT